jgi:hypothetical protein
VAHVPNWDGKEQGKQIKYLPQACHFPLTVRSKLSAAPASPAQFQDKFQRQLAQIDQL